MGHSVETIDTLYIHCAATPNGQRRPVSEIDRWHKENRWKRSNAAVSTPRFPHIGYHAVIDIDGNTVVCRDPSEQGAHAYPDNTNSLGVCLLGTDKFTPQQWVALAEYVANAERRWPGIRVRGHGDLNPNKTCPGFSVPYWNTHGRKPLANHIYRPEQAT